MESWQTAVVVVVALLAGALLPVLVQLSLTLRTSRTVMEDASVRLGRTLDAAAATAERLDRITAGLEQTVAQVRDSVRVASAMGAAVAPAVSAAVRAWRAGADGGGEGTPEGAGEGDVRAGRNGKEEQR